MAKRRPVSRPALPRRCMLAVVGLALILGIVISACSASPPAAATRGPTSTATPSTSTQTSDEGQVTVKVTWTDPSAGLAFAVVMDTHAVDLDGYDLKQLAVLRTDQGREVQPNDWDAPKGGHHRSGTLTFPTNGPDGKSLIGPHTRTITLVIRDVAGVPERVFRWAL